MIYLMKTIIVDKDDNYLTVKDAKALSQGDIYRVSALWLTNSKNQVLLAQRTMEKQNDPGKWGPAVSGTLEEGETYESNIYREAEEEIGVKGIVFQAGPKLFNDDGYKYFVQWYACQLDWPLSKFRPQKSEVEKLAWVEKNQLLKDIAINPNKYIKTAYKFKELLGEKND